MKKIFTLIAAVLFAGSMMAEEGLLFEQTYPGNPDTITNAYTKVFTMTTNGYTLTYANINNGQNASSKWDAIRCGRKNDASVATISSAAIAEKVSKVIVDFTQVDASKTNKLALLVADNADFTDAAEIVQTIAVGEITFVVETTAENKYYQILIDMEAQGNNGFNRIDMIRFISPDGGTPIVPTVYDTLTVAQAKAICDTLPSGASSEDKYYVEGYAVYVQPYSTQYKNQIFFMVDDVNAPDSLFEAYGAVGMKDNQPYPVLEGDKVRVFGKLKKYGTQLEITNPTIEFLVEVPGDRTIEPEKMDTINVTEAIAIAAALTPEKGKSATTSKTYAVKGFVVGISTTKTNTFYLADEKGAYGEFQAYQCASVDSEVAENDYVIVTGKIMHYYGESASSGEYHNYEISGGTLIHAEAPQGIENIILTEKAQKVVVDGVIYIVRDNKLFNLQGTQIR